MVYLQATVKLQKGAMEKFCTTLQAIIPRLEPLGWFLVGGYTFMTGPKGSVMNLWQAPDANALGALPAQIAGDSALSQLFIELNACIESEIYNLLGKAPYSR
jgi:hypothetical protein